jgi:urea carboxylase-associated protein 2
MPAKNDPKVTPPETLRGGRMWSCVLNRGDVLTLTNVEGDASIAGLFYNARQPLERYNMPDTLKAQHTAHLTAGCVLYSDMGHVLMSITEDTYGWHDTITGCMNRKLSEEKYGAGTYQNLRNEFYRNTRDNFLVELGKYGLGRKDVIPNVNFFTKVVADVEGNLVWASERKPGSVISLRAEMNVLVVLSNTPHPYEQEKEYAPSLVQVEVFRGGPFAASDDRCRMRCPENERGFVLTEAMAVETGGSL